MDLQKKLMLIMLFMKLIKNKVFFKIETLLFQKIFTKLQTLKANLFSIHIVILYYFFPGDKPPLHNLLDIHSFPKQIRALHFGVYALHVVIVMKYSVGGIHPTVELRQKKR